MPGCWASAGGSSGPGLRRPAWSSRTGRCCRSRHSSAREPAVLGVSVVCHGSDVWGTRLRLRGHVENHLLRRSFVRVVAVSSFTAGVLARGYPASVLPPGLSGPWLSTLVAASRTAWPASPVLRLITAFRLADWRAKGLPELLAAITSLGRPDIQPDDLRERRAARGHAGAHPAASVLRPAGGAARPRPGWPLRGGGSLYAGHPDQAWPSCLRRRVWPGPARSPGRRYPRDRTRIRRSQRCLP